MDQREGVVGISSAEVDQASLLTVLTSEPAATAFCSCSERAYHSGDPGFGMSPC
jgi:hypothetical protein